MKVVSGVWVRCSLWFEQSVAAYEGREAFQVLPANGGIWMVASDLLSVLRFA